jgi:hypothetical protein
MNITECKEMKRIKKHDMVSTVIDHIFTICKEDNNFNLSGNVEKIDKKVTDLNKKLTRQKSLIEQSDVLKANILDKIKRVDDESFKLKYKILETLGSEI